MAKPSAAPAQDPLTLGDPIVDPNAPATPPGQSAAATSTGAAAPTHQDPLELGDAAPDLIPPPEVTAQTTPVISRGFRNIYDVRHAPTESIPAYLGGMAQQAARGATFNYAPEIESALLAGLDQGTAPRWASRFGPNAGVPPPPAPATAVPSFSDDYNKRLAAIQTENAQFAANNPLASALAWGTGAIGGGTGLMRVAGEGARLAAPVVSELPGIAPLSRLGARLMAPSLEAAPEDASLLSQLKGPAWKMAKGYMIPHAISYFLPGAGEAGEYMANLMGAKGMLEGGKEGAGVLWRYLRNLAMRRAAAGIDPTSSTMPPPEAPPAPAGRSVTLSFPGEGGVSQEIPLGPTPPRPLLRVPPGYTYGQGMTPPGGPSSWTGYQP